MIANVFEFLKQNPTNIVVENEKEAFEVEQVFKYLGLDYVVFPDFRANEGDDLRSYRDELFALNNALYKYYKNDVYVISPIYTILSPLLAKKYFNEFKFEFGDRIDLNEIKEKLILWGYENVSIVQEKGEVSFRGDIIDIWPINYEHPFRISLFDVDIESIKIFDEYTQKSIDEVEEFFVIPAIADIDEDEYKDILLKIENSDFDTFYKDYYSLGYWFLDKEKFDKKVYFTKDMTQIINEIKSFRDIEDLDYEIIPPATKYKKLISPNIKEIVKNNYKKINLLAENEVLLKEQGIEYDFIKTDAILNLESEDEIIVSLNKPKQKLQKNAILIDDLKVDDFVVHQEHGIGQFKGLKLTKVLGKASEFAEIKYYGDDKLLLPVENLYMIQRYIAPGGVIPTLDKLGKGSFQKQKKKIEEKLFSIASDIINVAAKRNLLKPFKINLDGLDEFIKKAGFEYTIDQKKAVENIKQEMQTKIMDMLLSGDVGFGKTEIAMVASYIIANSNKQVAVIVPTTILVNQHYKSFIERFQDYDFVIEKYDRFTSAKEKKRIQQDLKDKKIDILISTHGAFNLEFADLGLVIVDEEHKFGVKQKEKLKNLTQNTHMLSMSATPIPRSLNLALSKIKSLSTLTTPPKNKQNTRTFVKEYDKNLIKEVIFREIRRGGQVFYIYNNIAMIERKKEELLSFMPNLRILTLHAKLTPNQIEKSMIDFINKEYDLALTTTIVESGIHIPNVNTVIVENADRFGIADLHQIRGRVGRGEVEGYAYFLVEDKEKLSQDAKKRLLALEENSFLGSGAVLAMHDLEIRGGGNIIGEAQSGQIKNVGYSLYIKMLEDAIKKLTGEFQEDIRCEIKLNISAYIDENLIPDNKLRIDLYKRLSNATTLEEIFEIEKEIIDRFGKIDENTQLFIEKMKIRVLADKKNITNISNYNENIMIIYKDGTKENIKSKYKDDIEIVKTILEYLR